VPKPLDAAVRAAILTDIRAGTLSRNAIARKHGVAQSTVTKLAKDTGDTTAFDRSQTKKATAAAVADNASERAAQSAQMLRLTRVAMDRLAATLPSASPMVAVTAFGILADKHLAFEAHDAVGTGTEDVRSMLGDLAEGIRRAVNGE
jgi:hypothetical protein